MSKVLVIEDSVEVLAVVRELLHKAGHSVLECQTGSSGLAAIGQEPDLVILDLNLPDLDGFEVCRRLRAISPIPILMLTARDEDSDMISGLEMGADDYITKPFKPQELLARIGAHLRRASLYARQQAAAVTAERLVCGPVTVGLDERRAWADGQLLSLTHTEFDILTLLMQKIPAAVPRDHLLAHIWGGPVTDLDSRTVDNHIARLRRKLPGRAGQAIETVPGVGYRFRFEW